MLECCFLRCNSRVQCWSSCRREFSFPFDNLAYHPLMARHLLCTHAAASCRSLFVHCFCFRFGEYMVIAMMNMYRFPLLSIVSVFGSVNLMMLMNMYLWPLSFVHCFSFWFRESGDDEYVPVVTHFRGAVAAGGYPGRVRILGRGGDCLSGVGL